MSYFSGGTAFNSVFVSPVSLSFVLSCVYQGEAFVLIVIISIFVVVVCLQIPGISLISYSSTAGAEEVCLFLQERVSHHCLPERSYA